MNNTMNNTMTSAIENQMNYIQKIYNIIINICNDLSNLGKVNTKLTYYKKKKILKIGEIKFHLHKNLLDILLCMLVENGFHYTENNNFFKTKFLLSWEPVDYINKYYEMTRNNQTIVEEL